MPRHNLPRHRYGPVLRKLPPYEVGGASLKEQHIRLAPARAITAAGIPCILWLTDAMSFAHRMPCPLVELQLLVPDNLVIDAALVLESETTYKRTNTPNPAFLDLFDKNLVYPAAIRLEHPSAANFYEDEAWPFVPPPYVDILPQSYFALDTRDSGRFRTLVPPLHPDNAQILMPRYHTLLEGLVSGIMDPPLGWETHCRNSLGAHANYMIAHRLQLDPERPPEEAVVPGHQIILSEVNEECRIILRSFIYKNSPPIRTQQEEYHRIRDARLQGLAKSGSIKISPDYKNLSHCGIRPFSSLASAKSYYGHSQSARHQAISNKLEKSQNVHQARLLVPGAIGRKTVVPLSRSLPAFFQRAFRLL